MVIENSLAICLSDQKVTLIGEDGSIQKSVQFEDITDAYKLYFSEKYNHLTLSLGIPSYFVLFNDELDIIAIGVDERWEDRKNSSKKANYVRDDYFYYPWVARGAVVLAILWTFYSWRGRNRKNKLS